MTNYVFFWEGMEGEPVVWGGGVAKTVCTYLCSTRFRDWTNENSTAGKIASDNSSSEKNYIFIVPKRGKEEPKMLITTCIIKFNYVQLKKV